MGDEQLLLKDQEGNTLLICKEDNSFEFWTKNEVYATQFILDKNNLQKLNEFLEL